jgi:hypothetical protein
MVVAHGHANDAAIQRLRAFETLDDVHEGDIVRRPRQCEAAVAPFNAPQDPTADQALEDLGQEIAWQISAVDQVVQQDAPFGRTTSQLTEPTDGVFGGVGENHSGFLRQIKRSTYLFIGDLGEKSSSPLWNLSDSTI